MSLDSGFPIRASDENYLLNEFGARLKNSSKRLTVTKDGPVNHSALENERNTAPTSCRTEADDSGEPVVCCSARLCSWEAKWRQWSAVGVVVVAVLFGVCFCALLIHVDGRYASEVAGLRQELQQLRHLCHFGKAPSPGSFAGDVVHGVAADSGGTGGLLWNPAGPHPAGEPESFQNAASVWGQDRQAWSNQDDDGYEDDEEDIEDSDVDQSGENDDDDENRVDEGFLHRIRRAADTPGNRRKGRSCRKYQRCKKAQDKGKPPKKGCADLLACPEKAQDKSRPLDKRCKKIMTCFNKEKPSELQTSKVMQPPSPAFVPQAVHFFSDFWKGRRQQEFGKDLCIYVEEWEATACRNRTVHFSTPYTPLKFLEAADWMKKMYKNQSEWPIQKGDGGTFIVQRSGLYLIYSSVMYHDLKPRQSHAVVVNGQKLFKCMDSVDYVDKDLPANNNQAKYKTCAMTGVTHLTEADRLEVQNLYERTEIDLSTDATYFGAVLLSPGLVTDPR